MDFLKINAAKSTDGELKKFGFIFGPLAFAISIWQGLKGHWGYGWFFMPAGLYAIVLALVRPRGIYPLRLFLEVVFKIFMWATTHAVLILCFYFVLTPIGVIMRLMGKDLLHKDFDAVKKSYWKDRDQQEFDPAHYLKQF